MRYARNVRWLGLLALVACNASIGVETDAGMGSSVLSDDMQVPPDMGAPLGPWGAPVPLDYDAVDDDDPSATADMLEVYFDRDNDVWRITRPDASSPWTTPERVDELSSASDETTPKISYDGLTIYVSSNRSGTAGSYDVWVSTRLSRADAWSTPVRVPSLSSSSSDGGATSGDGLAMVLDSNRDGNPDIYITERASVADPWPTPTVIENINTSDSEGNPMLSHDRLMVLFDSNRTGTGKLYFATRTSPTGTFSLAQQIEELSGPGSDTDPWISPDGRTLLFTSDRDGILRIWQSTR